MIKGMKYFSYEGDVFFFSLENKGFRETVAEF